MKTSPPTFDRGSPTVSPDFKPKLVATASQSQPRLPSDAAVFVLPDKLVRIFDRDLTAAGIPKTDERGRTLDVHALRTTFGTLLSKGAFLCGRHKPRCGIPTRA